MPIVVEGTALPEDALVELVRSLEADLAELEEETVQPSHPVLDPASIETARDLVRSARRVLSGASSGRRDELAQRANLAYAVQLAVIDLLKSHTRTSKVPRSRTGGTTPTDASA